MVITLPASNREDAVNRLATALLAACPGKQVKVEFKEYRRDRSNPQCRYLNGVVYKILSQVTGYERDDISEYLMIEYFGGKEKLVPGKRKVTVPVRTTTMDADGNRSLLTTSEFEDYVAFVQRFGARHGIFIPSPNEAA